MYGSMTATGAGGATLAATGLTLGSWILAAIGVIFVIAGVLLLIKKDSKNRP